MSQCAKDREISCSGKEAASQNNRFTADLVGQRAKDDKEWCANDQRCSDQ